mmetsp:Transcript_20286/g.57366  ORF Transcript_20286/g.57366 Transcript_20286/m.57366 type:complete len:338 (-) Transcript_20286:67-1080(-)
MSADAWVPNQQPSCGLRACPNGAAGGALSPGGSGGRATPTAAMARTPRGGGAVGTPKGASAARSSGRADAGGSRMARRSRLPSGTPWTKARSCSTSPAPSPAAAKWCTWGSPTTLRKTPLKGPPSTLSSRTTSSAPSTKSTSRLPGVAQQSADAFSGRPGSSFNRSHHQPLGGRSQDKRRPAFPSERGPALRPKPSDGERAAPPPPKPRSQPPPPKARSRPAPASTNGGTAGGGAGGASALAMSAARSISRRKSMCNVCSRSCKVSNHSRNTVSRKLVASRMAFSGMTRRSGGVLSSSAQYGRRQISPSASRTMFVVSAPPILCWPKYIGSRNTQRK